MKLAWTAAALASAVRRFVAAAHNVPLGSVALTAPGDSVVIPFIFRGNHVLVRGSIGDSDSLWFFVDSGAGSHCINRSRADKLGMKVDGGVEAIGAGGKVQAGAAHDVKYRLPGLAVDAEFAAAIDLDPIALQIGVPVDGILGYPLFKQMVVTVDYDRSVLVLHDPAKYRPAGAVLPLTFHENHPYVNGKLTLAGRKPVEGSFHPGHGIGAGARARARVRREEQGARERAEDDPGAARRRRAGGSSSRSGGSSGSSSGRTRSSSRSRCSRSRVRATRARRARSATSAATCCSASA